MPSPSAHADMLAPSGRFPWPIAGPVPERISFPERGMRLVTELSVVGETPVNAVQSDGVIGETLGNYRIVKELGQGGFGVVYLAQHPLLGKKVAVKLLLPAISANKEIVDRFFNEARAATLIGDSGIVDVFDFGHHTNGSAYFVMEFL